MLDVPTVLRKAADKGNFVRTRFAEDNIPTTHSNVVAMPFFGDLRSTFVLSSILLKRYREEVKGSKYFVLVSWPGFDALFPYVDEYWTIRNESDLAVLNESTNGLANTAGLMVDYHKNLNYFFDVVHQEEWGNYYENGLKKEFFDRFGHVKKFLPAVPSTGILGADFIRNVNRLSGWKVVISPTRFMRKWTYGKQELFSIKRQFWVDLVEYLKEKGFSPIILTNFTTYDLSSDLKGNYLYIAESDIGRVLGAMRAIGCVLDIFQGISRLALAARCPYLALDERARYNGVKENEVDGLCGEGVPREHIFSFPTILEGDEESTWKVNFFDTIVAKLLKFLPDLDRDRWPSTTELEEVVLYEKVSKKTMKKLGTRFIKVGRD